MPKPKELTSRSQGRNVGAVIQLAISKERLAQAGYYSIPDRYESLYLCD